MDGNELFDKLLSIQEKSIVAWDRTFNKIEKLGDEIERLAHAVEKKIDSDAKVTRWLKAVTVVFGFLGGVVAVIVGIMQM